MSVYLKDNKKIMVSTIFVLLVGMLLFNPLLPLQANTVPDRGTDPIFPDAPRITSLSISNPQVGSPVAVTVTIRDVESAGLYAEINGFEPRPIIMTSSGDTFYGNIPAGDWSDSVRYWIEATGEGGKSSSGIGSYTLPPEPTNGTDDNIVYKAVFTIYNNVDGGWVIVPVGGVLSGTIKIDLTVTSGGDYVHLAKMSFWKLNNGSWDKINELRMTGLLDASGVAIPYKYSLQYDTTHLENALYDIWYDLEDSNGIVIFQESIFGGDSGGVISIEVFYGLIVVMASVTIVLWYKKRM